MKKIRWIIGVIFILVVIVMLALFIFMKKNKVNSEEVIVSDNNLQKEAIIDVKKGTDLSNDEDNFLIEGDFLSDNIVSDEELNFMKHNTSLLQELIDLSQEGSIIKIPSGIFYFASSGYNQAKTEEYVVKLRSNISIIGSGTNENDGSATILKPYAKDGDIKYGLDMFYYNELRDSGFTNPKYLVDADFKDFIIDGESVRGENYNSSGKGFMINLCRDCDWDNVIVRNTDGTGFGMDNTINATIRNCKAINCGKNAPEDSTGGSGFGIGIGYSDDESMYIENCEAIDNKRYGFFFEHQGRFNPVYKATSGRGFVVYNSSSSGNLYNYGGERANDVVYIDSNSKKDERTLLDVYFTDDSRRTYTANMKINTILNDVQDENKYYYDSIYWALSNSITNGISSDDFGSGKYAKRSEAITLLWRMTGRDGNVLTSDDLRKDNPRITNIKTGFIDVPGDSWYANAVKWALDEAVTNGTSNNKFSPEEYITRAQFVTMLWRYSGKPSSSKDINFIDVSEDRYYYSAVKWAYENNIIKGKTSNTFAPDDYCLREDIILMLYRYQNSSNARFPIKYMLMGGEATNPNDYTNSSNIVINNPVKEGYTFAGWIGSNGDLKKNASIKNSKGNKIYVATYTPNNYIIRYNANGGSGNMIDTSTKYNEYVRLSSNEFKRSNYKFMGWSKSSNGEVIYNDCEIVKNLTNVAGETINLYAIWEKL